MQNQVVHPTFDRPEAEGHYGVVPGSEADDDSSHMPNDVTREHAERMHYAAYRLGSAPGVASHMKWLTQYVSCRNSIVVGNHKLIYRAVHRWKPPAKEADDLVGDCRVLLIHVAAAYNPWLGVRFSTYAFKCLMRSLSRSSQRLTVNPLVRALSLELVPDRESRATPAKDPPASYLEQIKGYLSGPNEVLSAAEQQVIQRRFSLDEQTPAGTLAQVGKELGLSKERVRIVQTNALRKLRNLLLAAPPSPAEAGVAPDPWRAVLPWR